MYYSNYSLVKFSRNGSFAKKLTLLPKLKTDLLTAGVLLEPYWSNAISQCKLTTQFASSCYVDRTTRGISYPDKKLENEYVILNYSPVKFLRTLANREYCENNPPRKIPAIRYIYMCIARAINTIILSWMLIVLLVHQRLCLGDY